MLAINEAQVRYAEYKRTVDAHLRVQAAMQAKAAKARGIIQTYQQALDWVGGKLVEVGQHLHHHAIPGLHEQG